MSIFFAKTRLIGDSLADTKGSIWVEAIVSISTLSGNALESPSAAKYACKNFRIPKNVGLALGF